MSGPRKAARSALGFTVVLEPDETDGGFVVHCPELQGCWSQGDTPEDAIHNICDAIAAWLAVHVEQALELSRQSTPREQLARGLTLSFQVP
jgi:predicted RNase H-like HicB family nuclease